MPTETSRSSRLPGRRALIAVIVILLAVPVVWLLARDHPGEAAIKEYFAALRDKDADAALALVERGAGAPREAFAAPEALGGDWELTGTDVIDESASTVEVRAEFATPEGEVSGDYELVADDPDEGPWKIRNPFVTVTVEAGAVSPAPVDYLQVNDAVAELRDSEYEITLFPGVYDFYRDVPGVVDFADTDPVALFGAEPYAAVPPDATAGPDALAAVQQLVDDRIAVCLESIQAWPDGCPFALPNGTVVRTGGLELDYFADAEWTLESFPAIVIEDRPADSEGMFVLRAADPASTVTLAVHGFGDGGDVGTDFTTTCTFEFSVWPVHLLAEDGNVRFDFPSPTTSWPSETTCETELD